MNARSTVRQLYLFRSQAARWQSEGGALQLLACKARAGLGSPRSDASVVWRVPVARRPAGALGHALLWAFRYQARRDGAIETRRVRRVNTKVLRTRVRMFVQLSAISARHSVQSRMRVNEDVRAK